MKTMLPILSIIVVFAACKSEPKKDADYANSLAPVNTAGYNMSNASTDIPKLNEDGMNIPASKRKPQKKYNTIVNKQTEYIPKVEQQNPAPVSPNTTTASTAPAQPTGKNPPASPGTSNSGTSVFPGTSMPSETGNASNTGSETASTKKKGWSDAVKGAVIGGAAGAIGGAIINGKNRGKGAIIGAVLGAAGGYVIGRKKDKKKDAANDYSMVVN